MNLELICARRLVVYGRLRREPPNNPHNSFNDVKSIILFAHFSLVPLSTEPNCDYFSSTDGTAGTEMHTTQWHNRKWKIVLTKFDIEICLFFMHKIVSSNSLSLVDAKFIKFSSFRIERRFLKRSQVFERKIVTHNNARDQNEVYLCVCLSIAYIYCDVGRHCQCAPADFGRNGRKTNSMVGVIAIVIVNELFVHWLKTKFEELNKHSLPRCSSKLKLWEIVHVIR